MLSRSDKDNLYWIFNRGDYYQEKVDDMHIFNHRRSIGDWLSWIQDDTGIKPQRYLDVLVDYYRSGGIAGFNDRLVIFDNGIALVSSKTINSEVDLNQTDIDNIIILFNQAQFLDWKEIIRHVLAASI